MSDRPTLENREVSEAVEITPAMIEAGASVLCGMTLAYAGEGYWAKEIYRAMELRRSEIAYGGAGSK